MAYADVKKKYKLPEWGMLKRYFEVEEADEFPTRHARRKIEDKLDHIIGILESLLHPDTGSISNLHEHSSIDEEMMKKIQTLFKKLMYYLRESTALSVSQDEEAEAVFIKKLYKKWPSIQAEMKPICEELKDCWEKDVTVKIDTGYLG